MAVGTPDFALSDLVPKPIERPSATDDVGHVRRLHASDMIELKDHHVRLAAVHARMGGEVCVHH
jgi:hypothetical protein